MIAGYETPALEDVLLWHERDISHLWLERMCLPELTGCLDYIRYRSTSILDVLDVSPERMKANMNLSHGLIYSQRVMLKLFESGLSREQAYDLVYGVTAMLWDEHRDSRPLLEADPEMLGRLSEADLDELFDYVYVL